MAQLTEDIIKHWHSFKNPIINDVLINLEKLETDVPALSDAEIDKIKQLLEHCTNLKANKADPEQLIKLLNQLPAPYMLYIIHKLQTLNNELIMKVINFAQSHKETDPEVASFFQRNMVFEKSQLLGRIFSTNRMEAVLGVL